MRGPENVWLRSKARPARPEAFDRLRIGDVIRWNKRLRTVRTLTRTPDGAVRMVGFAKVRRSGLPGPITQYTRFELRTYFGGIVVRRKGRLCATPTECAVTKDIEDGLAGNRVRITEDGTVGAIW